MWLRHLKIQCPFTLEVGLVSVACNYPSFIIITTVTTCNKDTVMCYQCSLKLSLRSVFCLVQLKMGWWCKAVKHLSWWDTNRAPFWTSLGQANTPSWQLFDILANWWLIHIILNNVIHVLPFRCAVKCSLFIIKLLVSVLITSYKFRQFNVKKTTSLKSSC